MYHETGKMSAEERVREEITPDQPSADDLIKHYDNCKIMRNADTALKHAKKKHNHFLNNFELVVERHASLTAPTGEGLIIKVSVQCGRCQLLLSAVNVHRHKCHLKGRQCILKTGSGSGSQATAGSNAMTTSAPARTPDTADAAAVPNSVEPGQQRMTQFTLPSGLAESFKDNFARLIFEACGSVPLVLIEHPRVKAMFSMVGITPPSRKWLSGVKLNTVYAEVMEEMKLEMQAGDGLLQIAADGWRSKYVDNGDKLINIMLLFPGGGSFFHKVIRVQGEAINQESLSDMLWSAVMDVFDGDEAAVAQRLLGFVMDAEAVNPAAFSRRTKR